MPGKREHKKIPRAPGKRPKRKGYGKQRARQIAEYNAMKARVLEALKQNPRHTAKSLQKLGFPYDTANRILRDLERAGQYMPPFDRAKAIKPKSREAMQRREWLFERLRQGKTIKEILLMKGSPYKSRQSVYRDIYHLRLAGKKVVVPIADPIGFQVVVIEEMIRKNPAVQNAEIMKRLGLKSHASLVDRLRRVNPEILEKRTVPRSRFSRQEIAEQNRVIAEMTAKGKSTKEIKSALEKLGFSLSEKQIRQRVSGSAKMREIARGKRPIGRSRFSAEEIARQNTIILALAEQGQKPAQMVGRKGLEGLSKKDIRDRMYRHRKKKGGEK